MLMNGVDGVAQQAGLLPRYDVQGSPLPWGYCVAINDVLFPRRRRGHLL